MRKGDNFAHGFIILDSRVKDFSSSKNIFKYSLQIMYFVNNVSKTRQERTAY